MPYHAMAMELMKEFELLEFCHVQKKKNDKADAFANTADGQKKATKEPSFEGGCPRVCGAHRSGPKMRVKLKQMGYYWPIMVQNCMDYVKRCNICQIHGDSMPNPLRPTVASWPIFLMR
ncbi:conserved hypothetical protein [Ricinus communis]|uniref:Integrase zinc-binding domain-containing protein n=2 Tax=Ricinus communis TaxID=3988 RepID=B9TAM1_RICCO|nr:conserved hypothetical protein [Ricinus communis]